MSSTHPIPAGVPTREVRMGRGVLADLPAVLGSLGHAPPAGCLVIDDARTHAAAGEHVGSILEAAGHAVRLCTLADDANDEVPADAEQVDQVVKAARSRSASEMGEAGGGASGAAEPEVVLGVGSGVLNDLGKLAAHRLNGTYVAVATAASVNGYGSPVAAYVERGVKRTRPTACTAAIVADLDVICAAPLEMTRSGFADLLSKGSATADWRLAHLVRGEAYDPRPHELLDPVVRECQAHAAAIGRAEPQAVGMLMRGLLDGAFAMTLAGHSAPASGGEHLISHLWDMQTHATHGRHHLHGFQVAFGTRVVAALYQMLMRMEQDDLDVDRLAERWTPWEARRPELERTHGELYPVVEPEAKKQALSQAALREELSVIRDRWPRIKAAVEPLLLSPERILALHREAGVPESPAAVGQSRSSVRHALLHAKDVRARFTVLDLAKELGVLEPWADQVLDEAHIH